MANFINTVLDPEVPEEAIEIQQRENIANKQSEQFEFLFNLYKAMTPLEGRRRYLQHFKVDCGERVPGARYEDLISKGIIYKSTQRVMEENGAKNFVWKLLPKDGTIPEDFNIKKQKVSVEVIFNEDTGEVDDAKTTAEFFDKLNKYKERNNLHLNKIEMAQLPTNEVELEYYIHELFLKANSNLTETNIGARVGRYLHNLKSDGTIQNFRYERDDNNRLKTTITVGAEPDQISTFKDVMNRLYIQEKKWGKIKL